MKPPATLFCSISFGSCRSSTRPQPKIRLILLRFGLVKCALAWLLLKSSSKGWAAIYRFQKHLLYSIHSFSHGGRFSKLNRLVVVCTASPVHCFSCALLLLISACLVTPTPVHCFSSYQFTSSSPRQQLQITTILIYPLKKFLTCVEIERSSPSALCRAGQGCSYVLQVCLAGMGG